MARTVGVDYGDKRIGLALSDETATVATPWRVLPVRTREEAAKELAALLQAVHIGCIVIGLPMRMDGGEGPAAEKARSFGEALAKHVDVPIQYWDERFSTRTAEQALIAGGARRQKRKQVVDKLAAQIILQHYLDVAAGLPDLPAHAL